jgi:hypothetical protein
MEKRLNGSGLDPAIRNRVLKAFEAFALDQSAVNGFDNLREATDRAMRAVARLKLELHGA